MSIKVLADGVELDPSEYTITAGGHISIRSGRPLTGTISILYEETDAASWKYGDVVRWRMPDGYFGSGERFMVVGGQEADDRVKVICLKSEGSWDQGDIGEVPIASLEEAK